MKFKGFFKSYFKLCKDSLIWLKDYWFCYILLCIAIALPYMIYTIYSWIDLKKTLKEINKDEENNG